MSRSFAEARVHTPTNVSAALEFLSERHNEGWKPLAGATDALVPIYRDGADPKTPWLNLQRLRPELRFVRSTSDGFEIGALATVADLMVNESITLAMPMLYECGLHFASPAIRNRATLAGNIANGSPAADLAPVLLAFDAEIELANRKRHRWISLDKFWTGYRTNVMEPDELIVTIRIPHRRFAPNAWIFRKVAPRASNSISLLNFAATGERDESGNWVELTMAFGCMGPYPLRPREVERIVAGRRFDDDCRAEVRQALRSTLAPITDHRASREYRQLAATNLAMAFLEGTIGHC